MLLPLWFSYIHCKLFILLVAGEGGEDRGGRKVSITALCNISKLHAELVRFVQNQFLETVATSELSDMPYSYSIYVTLTRLLPLHIWTKSHFALTAFSSTDNRRWQCALLARQCCKLHYFLPSLILHNQYDHSYSETWFAIPFVLFVPRLWPVKQAQLPVSCASFRGYECFFSLHANSRVYQKFSQKSVLWALPHSRWQGNLICFLTSWSSVPHIFFKWCDLPTMCSFGNILWCVQLLLVCTGFFFQ